MKHIKKDICPTCKNRFDKEEDYSIYSYEHDKFFCSRKCLFEYKLHNLER